MSVYEGSLWPSFCAEQSSVVKIVSTWSHNDLQKVNEQRIPKHDQVWGFAQFTADWTDLSGW
jgi:hypothetical protein